MKSFLRDVVLLIRRVIRHDIWGLSAQTAFFLMLSVFPLLMFLVSLLNQANISLSYDALILFLPADIANLVLEIGKLAPSEGNWPLWSVILSTWSASAGIWAMMRGIHRAYRQKRMSSPIRYRLLSLLFTFAFGVVLLLSLLLTIFGRNVADYITYQLGTESFVLTPPIRRMIMFGVLFVFLSALYTLTPGVGGRFKSHMPGALCAAAGWILSSLVYEAYINNFSKYTTIYGSIGAFLGLMIWLLIICIIVLFGAELNAYLRDKAAKQADSPLHSVS